MKLKLTSLLALSALLSVAFVTPSCADKKSTAITVAITSEAKVPQGVKYVEIIVTRKGQVKLDKKYLVQQDQTIKLPGTLAVKNDDDEDASTPITVKIEAAIATGKGVDKKVIRSATLGFSEEKQKVLRMPIRFACADFECPSGETCKSGRCEADTLDPESLDDFVEADVIPTTGNCFSKDACLAAGGKKILIPIEDVADVLGDDCTVPYVFDDDADLAGVKDITDPKLAALRDNVNMGFIWSGDYNVTNANLKPGASAVWTVIDNDSDEGWQFADTYAKTKNPKLTGDDMTRRVVLTPGLCAAALDDKKAILAARAAAATPADYVRPPTKLLGTLEVRGCAPKKPNMPECLADQTGTTGK